MTRTVLALLALSLVLPASALADDKRTQYRTLKLTDGREFVAEVLSTEAGGLRLSAPQGEVIVPFELLVDMSPADRDMYDLQEAWHVYLASPVDYQQPLAEAFRWVDGVTVHLSGDKAPGMTLAQTEAATDCKRDLNCLREVLADAPWMWVVRADKKGTGVVAYAALNRSPTQTIFESDDMSSDSRWLLVHDLLQIELPAKGGPPKTATTGVVSPSPAKKPARTPSEASDGLAFVPVPGITAGKSGSAGKVIGSVLLTTAGTAAFVGAVGHGSQSVPELAGLGAVGFYANVVVWNHAFK